MIRKWCSINLVVIAIGTLIGRMGSICTAFISYSSWFGVYGLRQAWIAYGIQTVGTSTKWNASCAEFALWTATGSIFMSWFARCIEQLLADGFCCETSSPNAKTGVRSLVMYYDDGSSTTAAVEWTPCSITRCKLRGCQQSCFALKRIISLANIANSSRKRHGLVFCLVHW
jgi:hypothetical protein